MYKRLCQRVISTNTPDSCSIKSLTNQEAPSWFEYVCVLKPLRSTGTRVHKASFGVDLEACPPPVPDPEGKDRVEDYSQ